MNTVVDVAVDNAALNFDRLYSYRIPADLAQYAAVGSRVLVPFGSAAPRMGVVLKIAGSPDQDTKLKSVIDIERGEPLLGEELVQLIFMLKETTFCTYYDAVRAVLPKNSRLVPNDDKEKLENASRAHLETVYEYLPPENPPKLTEKQQAVCALIKNSPMTVPEICKALGVTRSVVERLAEKGIISRAERSKMMAVYPFAGKDIADIPDLTPAQRTAYMQILGYAADVAKPDTTLLHGVTSSGKTILYIKLIQKTVDEGKGALILVPEIALATQMIYRLRGQFGERVGIVHSALSDTERQLQWEKIHKGECDIVVGTRSAVFAPVKNLGIIIVDEEQENTYASEQNPRYSACRVAAFRIKQRKKHDGAAHLVLSSATPSVESYYKAKSGAYNMVSIPERYGSMPLPRVRVVDMRRELLAGNSHYVSKYLKDEIDARIERKEQCILLLNRRGYRPLSMCNRCKEIVKCESCDTPLVVHKDQNRYLCHYCGRSTQIAGTCAVCGGGIKHTGIGTQKIEEELEALFPSARILRLDVDAISKKHSVDKLLFDFAAGEYDIIIGTQMIAKGLDFPNVTLVGVLSIDQLMLMPSCRANERTFAMLTQVVGRSGRGDKKGEAIIQTIDPENDIIRLAAKQDYEGFYKDEIVSRKTHLYPPFCAMCTIGFISEAEQNAMGAADEFAEILGHLQTAYYSDMPLRVLGPSPMRVSYINNLYRFQIVIKYRHGRDFLDFLREAVQRFGKAAYSSKARYFVDLTGQNDN